jgi:hypothetical protein
MNGKGDAPRNCFTETYRENYDQIFRKKSLDGSKKTNKHIDRDDKNETTETGLRASVGASCVAVQRLDEPL